VFAGLATVFGLIVAATLFYGLGVGKQSAPRQSVSGVALVGGPFNLTDHTGQSVSNETYFGNPMLVYFGYTSCPDICPIDLHKLAKALEILGKDGRDLQPLFITIDPARDDVATMGGYVSAISPKITGLTGSLEQIAEVAGAYRVYFAKTNGSGEITDAEEDYWMTHSNLFYLMDAEGKYVTHFAADATPEVMAEALKKHLS
jgi:protein SCO1/2